MEEFTYNFVKQFQLRNFSKNLENHLLKHYKILDIKLLIVYQIT